ncbi:MAG: hypothetical protein JXQ71_07750 [Verrucomicrobia bacterium]|nr:hypothetical protein [Verrucomicrobiota bacterium]
MIMDYLKHPFVLGLGLGLAAAALVWIAAWGKRRRLGRESSRLREHLHTQMEISARGNESLREELGELRRQNENLRITNATLNQKSGKAELRALAVYDRALHLMYEQAPGFAPAWERVLKAAEDEVQKAERGLIPLIRKAFRPSLPAADREAKPLASGDLDQEATKGKPGGVEQGSGG